MWQKATYKPIPVNLLRNGRKGEKLTLVIRVTAPIESSDTGPQIGKVVETTTLHLQFNFSA
jgi:hypothetical protein